LVSYVYLKKPDLFHTFLIDLRRPFLLFSAKYYERINSGDPRWH